MSASYTLHLPAGARPGDAAALDRAVLVPDRFSVWAFLAPGLWLLVHRHWLPALGAFLVVGALPPLLALAGIAAPAIWVIEILLHLLLGLEGATLRRLDLAWRGRPVRDVVTAADLAEAETKGFARWLAAVPAGPPPLARTVMAPPPPRRGPEPVLGLFPDRETSR